MELKGNLLIVDDDIIITRLLETKLLDNPYTIHTTNSAHEALDIIKHHPIDVLLTDIMMPNMSGLELFTLSKKIIPNIQCIVITAFNELDFAIRALKLGAINYFNKPLNYEEVTLGLKQAFEKLHLINEVQKRQTELEISNQQLQDKIREQNEIKQTLIKQEEDYHNIFDYLEDAVFIVKKKKLKLVNPAFIRILGYRTAEVVDKPYHYFIVNEDLQYIEEQFSQGGARDNLPLACELRLIHKDGSIRHMDVVMNAVEMRGDKAIIGTMRNITDRKKAEEAKLEYLEKTLLAKNQAERVVKIKNQFISNISHEIRTPMHGILGFTQLSQKLLMSDAPDMDKVSNYLDKIEISANRLSNLLINLLDLSNHDSGKTKYEILQLDLVNLIEDVVVNTQNRLRANKQLLEINSQLSHIVVELDYTRISQVIENLLRNAIQYTPSNRKLTINIIKDGVSLNNHPAVEVSIVDQGVGIPEDELETIFDRFTQSSYTNDGAGGIGIGLSLCREIIEAHKGTIWAENNPNGGAIVKFQLPVYYA